jgi:hypothetical protein
MDSEEDINCLFKVFQNIRFRRLNKVTEHSRQDSGKPADILVLKGGDHLGDLGTDKRGILNLILTL